MLFNHLIYLLLSTLQPMPSLTHTTQKITLGDTTVQIVRYDQGPGKHFVHVHQNETTAKRAALRYIEQHGGTLLTLVHPGQRTISFHMNHHTYEFDPNRIFTPLGIHKTLSQYSHYSPKAARAVRKLALAVLHNLPRGKIIAVHNNEDYSLREYLPGHSLARDAAARYWTAAHFYRNFYLVTRPSTFKRLKHLQQNVILQAKHVQDDGSLSVRLTKRDYINIEAAYGALKQQIAMLSLA